MSWDTWDFRELLDANRAAANARRARRKGGGGGGSGDAMKDRVRELRRRVAAGELTLDEAEATDFDAYAEDLPRLEKLAAKYDERAGRAAAKAVGVEWQKSLVVITAPTRNGKDVLGTALGHELVRLAALAGREWQYIKPPGKNSLENVGRADVVHHEDMRFKLLPDYDEALRYFDPNQAVAASGRHKNRGTPTPRAIIATSSETLYSLGFTLKRRMLTEHLVEALANAEGKRTFALDIDEFLYRVGWHVEVEKPADAGDDFAKIQAGLLAKISRVRESGDAHRTMDVVDRAGNQVGRIRTQHVLEPVAVIRGVGPVARFLAAEILEERNPDIVAALGDEVDALAEGRADGETSAAQVAAEAAEFVDRVTAFVRAEQLRQWHQAQLRDPGDPVPVLLPPDGDGRWLPVSLPPGYVGPPADPAIAAQPAPDFDAAFCDVSAANWAIAEEICRQLCSAAA